MNRLKCSDLSNEEGGLSRRVGRAKLEGLREISRGEQHDARSIDARMPVAARYFLPSARRVEISRALQLGVTRSDSGPIPQARVVRWNQ